MIKAGKKFEGGRRYYHSHQTSAVEVRANPDWDQRQQMMRRDRRRRVLRIIGLILLCLGLVVGTFLLAMLP